MVTTALFWRANRRIKNVEAGKAELSLQNEQYASLRRQIDDLRKEVGELNALLHQRQGELTSLRREYGELQRKYSYKRIIINCALDCPNAAANGAKCPVLRKKAEVDLMYAKNEQGT